MEFTDIQKLLTTKALEKYRDGTIDDHLKDLLQEIIDIIERDDGKNKEYLEKLDELKITLKQEFLELLPHLNWDEYLDIDHTLLAATFRLVGEESEDTHEEY